VAAEYMVFSYFHETELSCHLGIQEKHPKIFANYAWKNMTRDIRGKVGDCHTCALSKPTQNTQLGYLTSEVLHRPLLKGFIHFVGKFLLSKTGNSVILVCFDA
jgi:hypothetical protein